MHSRQAFLAVLVLLLWPAAAGFAQTFEATVTGRVTDMTGAILPGVEVMATNQDTNVQMSALTDDRGYYTIVRLHPGLYRLEAELPGFRRYVQADIKLGVEQVGRIDIQLEVGEIQEEVRVVGEAPILNTETSSKGQVIYNEEIVDLPLEGRDFNELAFLTAGVIPKNEGGQGGFANINGARSDSVNFIVDGANNNILRFGDANVRPSLDSIQEFKVQTSNYSAEYGRRSTGVLNVILRSGTNAWHGTLFNFHRNAVLDARNFFDLADLDRDGELDKSKLVRNNFGGNIGGPIVRDSLFFFANFEGMRRREGQTRLARVPTLGERQGIMSGKTLNPFDCKKYHKDGTCDWQGNPNKTFKVFKNNRVPESLWHPFSRRALEFYPLPNAEIGAFNYVANKVDEDDFDDYTGKVDWYFGEGDSLATRYLLNNRAISNPFAGSDLPAFGNTGRQRFQLLGITYTKTFSASLVNQVLTSISRKTVQQFSRNFGTDVNAQLGVWSPEDPFMHGFPRVQITGYETMGDAANTPLDWTETDFHFSDTLTLVRGRHNIRLGGEMIRTQFFQLRNNNARGTFNFRNYWTRQPLADFLLGFPNNTNRRVRPVRNYLRSRTWSGFFQDDWKVARNLTLNLGVRWDLFVPPVDVFDNWSNFDPDIGGQVISGEPRPLPLPADQFSHQIFAGSAYPRALVYMDKNNFAPRLGFAWQPFSSRTVLRVGVGQFFGLSLLNPLRNSLGGNAPFSIQENFPKQNSIKDRPGYTILNMGDPFPTQRLRFAGLANPQGYEVRAPSANLYQYNLTIEQQWARDTVMELGYVGSKGTHLGRRYNINQTFWEVDGNGLPFSFKNWPALGGIQYYGFEADSNYHAFQATIRKRGRGTNWRLNYVFSKAIDDASRLNGAGDAGVAGVQDARNRHLERALSDFDRRHAVVGSILYRLPFRNHFLARGWQVNSIFRYYTGTPVSPEISNPDLSVGEATRPDRVGSGKLDNPTPERWYRVEHFPLVPAGSFRLGNSGRNVITGPDEMRWSFSVMRHFDMPREGHRIQFRWEVFNWPNQTNFFLPEEIVNIPTSGAIDRAKSARQMQVALKYIF